MKTNLLKTVLAGAALLVSSAVCAQIELAENVKNYFAVTGFNGNNEVTVSSTVFDGYSFEVQMPSTNNSVVKADKLRLDIAIQDVNSVGAKDQLRQESKEFETGAKSLTGDLQKLMANSYKFAGNQECVTVPVTVIDGARQKSFTYNISGSPIENKIIGVPETETDCRAAWAIITSNMKSFKKPLHDTYFGVRKGSYIELAGERMTFVNNKNLCEEPWTLDGVKRETLDNYEITATRATDAETYIAKIYLPAGSALAVGFSESILQKDALITFDLRALYETYGTALPKQISPLMDGMKTPETAVFSFIQAFDGLVGLICDAKVVPTTVEFTPAAPGFTVYPGSAEALYNQTEEQLEACQAQFPNTMAIQKYGESSRIGNVIELVDGEYVCKYFELTDLSKKPTPEFAASTAWYSPVDFIAIEGYYLRKNLTAGYASVCLPFAISTEMEGIDEILTYDSYDGDVWAYFVSGEENAAGVPCNIISSGEEDMDIEFDNTPIVATIANGNSTYGTYTATDEYATYYYGVNATINKFCPLAGNLYPFRACLDLQAGGKDVAAKIISTPTAIKNVESTNANTIYTVSGAKVSKIAQPGLYIVNGKKMFVK